MFSLKTCSRNRGKTSMSALGPGCVKTPQPSDGRSRVQMQRDMPLTGLGGDNALSVGDWPHLKT